jgi:hypothetical protein
VNPLYFVAINNFNTDISNIVSASLSRLIGQEQLDLYLEIPGSNLGQVIGCPDW